MDSDDEFDVSAVKGKIFIEENDELIATKMNEFVISFKTL
jgi:hypothetical protein